MNGRQENSSTTLWFMPASTEALAFGRRLKELRRRRGLSQKELAGAIDVHPLQVSKYETGTNYPTVGKVIEIAKALHVSMDELFGHVAADDSRVKNIRLLRRFKDLENLPKDDQETAVKLIDALVAKSKIKKLVG
jgi:transcriptional regulator with XRE-family HTH domain